MFILKLISFLWHLPLEAPYNIIGKTKIPYVNNIDINVAKGIADEAPLTIAEVLTIEKTTSKGPENIKAVKTALAS